MGDDDFERTVLGQPGGIFGNLDMVMEVDDELSDGPFPDGRDGVREKPGLVNRLGAVTAAEERGVKRRRREKMLLVERFVDEIPDTFRWAGDAVSRAVLAAKWKLVRNEAVGGAVGNDAELRSLSMSAVLTKKIVNVAYDTLAEGLSRAYAKEIARAEVQARLGDSRWEQRREDSWAGRKATAMLARVRAFFGGTEPDETLSTGETS